MRKVASTEVLAIAFQEADPEKRGRFSAALLVPMTLRLRLLEGRATRLRGDEDFEDPALRIARAIALG